jgi:hypothetical protein
MCYRSNALATLHLTLRVLRKRRTRVTGRQRHKE